MAKATQAKIVDNAQDLFWYKGHKATSLDEIAKSARQSKGAIFHYFSNKSEITQRVIEQYLQDEVLAPMKAHFDDNADVKVALKAWVQSIFDQFEAHDFKGGCLLGNFALELSDQDEAVRVTLEDAFHEWEATLVECIESHASADQMVLSPQRFAALIIAAFQGVTLTSKVHKDADRARMEFQILDELVEGFIV